MFAPKLMSRPTIQPSTTPATPPKNPIADASIRKMRRMSPSLPPIAFMIPISRVRSRIDITIVFMMPSDDTASAIDPIRLRTMSRMMNAALGALQRVVQRERREALLLDLILDVLGALRMLHFDDERVVGLRRRRVSGTSACAAPRRWRHDLPGPPERNHQARDAAAPPNGPGLAFDDADDPARLSTRETPDAERAGAGRNVPAGVPGCTSVSVLADEPLGFALVDPLRHVEAQACTRWRCRR